MNWSAVIGFLAFNIALVVIVREPALDVADPIPKQVGIGLPASFAGFGAALGATLPTYVASLRSSWDEIVYRATGYGFTVGIGLYAIAALP